MDYSKIIFDLYGRVYETHKEKYRIGGNRIISAIRDMKEVYLPNPGWRSDCESITTDYNDPAHRCAYLHKYAMVHTGLLCEILQLIFQQENIQRVLISKDKLTLCSLGGGPGTDIVSFLFIINQMFGYKQCTANIIDSAQEWKEVFESIINELNTGRYGNVSRMVSYWRFSYEYLRADLLSMSYYNEFKVLQAVKNADIITMIKFISAAACDKTKTMLKKIFLNMKLGAMLFFVDNAAGGFDRLIRETAVECGMVSVFGPLRHYDYENPSISTQRFGYKSQSKTKVTIEVWKKTTLTTFNTTQQLQREYIRGPVGRNVTSSSNVRLVERESQNEGCCSII